MQGLARGGSALHSPRRAVPPPPGSSQTPSPRSPCALTGVHVDSPGHAGGLRHLGTSGVLSGALQAHLVPAQPGMTQVPYGREGAKPGSGWARGSTGCSSSRKHKRDS